MALCRTSRPWFVSLQVKEFLLENRAILRKMTHHGTRGPCVSCGHESRYLTRFSLSEYRDRHDFGTVQPLFHASFTSASLHSRCLVSRAAGLPQGVSCQLPPLTPAPWPLGHRPSARWQRHRDLFLRQVKCPTWQCHPLTLGLVLLCPVLYYVESTCWLGNFRAFCFHWGILLWVYLHCNSPMTHLLDTVVLKNCFAL